MKCCRIVAILLLYVSALNTLSGRVAAGQPAGKVSDYVKVLQECRAMLDKHNIHGKQTKLIHWMWGGWGFQRKQTPSSTNFLRSEL